MTVAADFSKLVSPELMAQFQGAVAGGFAPANTVAANQPIEEKVSVGQMKTEAPEPSVSQEPAAAVGQNAGMASIIENLSAKAAEHAEQAALTASQPAAEQERSFAQYDKGGKFDVPLLNMLQDAVLGDKKQAQGQDCSLDDVACQNVGQAQRSQGVGQGR